MVLSKEEVGLFYDVLGSLLAFVNRRLGLIPKARSAAALRGLPLREMEPIRSALWKDPRLIDAFVDENPDGLTPEALTIAREWTRFVAGTFYVVRQLKKHAVFVGAGEKVYGVQGLTDPVHAILGERPLPVMVDAVLLPFRGRIVYDGILIVSPVTFGAGIRRDLNETYAVARENDRIIERLAPQAPAPRKAPARDLQPELDPVVAAAERLRGDTPVEKAALGVLKAAAALARSAAGGDAGLEDLVAAHRKVQTALNRFGRTVARAEAL